jgi:hypothetical protein
MPGAICRVWQQTLTLALLGHKVSKTRSLSFDLSHWSGNTAGTELLPPRGRTGKGRRTYLNTATAAQPAGRNHRTKTLPASKRRDHSPHRSGELRNFSVAVLVSLFAIPFLDYHNLYKKTIYIQTMLAKRRGHMLVENRTSSSCAYPFNVISRAFPRRRGKPKLELRCYTKHPLGFLTSLLRARGCSSEN